MSKNAVAPQSKPTTNRIERAMAYAIVVIVVLSLACFVAVIVATSMGVGKNDEFSHGGWLAVFAFMYGGLPLAFLLLIALLASNAARRSRAAKSGKR